MKTFYIILMYIAGLVLQTTFFSHLTFFGAKPDLLLIIIVFIAIKRGAMPGEIYGFVGGLMEDFVAYGFLGIQALTKTLMGFGAGFLKNKLEENNIILLMLLVFFTAIISGLLGNVARTFFSAYYFLAQDALRVFLSALYTMVLTPVIVPVMKKIYSERK
jgi:rod shape-determining protein MreD